MSNSICTYLQLLGLLTLLSFGCEQHIHDSRSNLDLPRTDYDLGYIPFDNEQDDKNFLVCDSTFIHSGRNRVQYKGGIDRLRSDIITSYHSGGGYQHFDGYVVVRFLVNCEEKLGRYRTQSLALDFSEIEAPNSLHKKVKKIIQDLDDWTIRYPDEKGVDYHKFINVKFEKGEIQHVLL